MKNYLTVEVPLESSDYYINNAGCLRYSEYDGKVSSCIEPIQIGEYLTNFEHKIIGYTIFNNKKLIIIEIL